MSESKELVFNVDADTVEKVFSTPNGLQPYLDQSKVVIDTMLAECGDVATAKGRAAYKSLARKVASLKNKIDGIGKGLVAELKEKPKLIDAERKRMRDMLEAWQAEISEPVESYEAEEHRKAVELAEKLEAEKLAAQVESDHEFALLLNAEFDRKRADEIAAAELARIEHERRIAEAAAAQAKADAERAAEEAARRAQEAIEAEKQARVKAEQDAEAARVKAINDAEAARVKAAQDYENARLKAIRDQEAAVEAERAKQAAEAARIKREDEQRAANVEHQRAVHREIIGAVVEAGYSEDFAKDLITAIKKSNCSRITINY